MYYIDLDKLKKMDGNLTVREIKQKAQAKNEKNYKNLPYDILKTLENKRFVEFYNTLGNHVSVYEFGEVTDIKECKIKYKQTSYLYAIGTNIISTKEQKEREDAIDRIIYERLRELSEDEFAQISTLIENVNEVRKGISSVVDVFLKAKTVYVDRFSTDKFKKIDRIDLDKEPSDKKISEIVKEAENNNENIDERLKEVVGNWLYYDDTLSLTIKFIKINGYYCDDFGNYNVECREICFHDNCKQCITTCFNKKMTITKPYRIIGKNEELDRLYRKHTDSFNAISGYIQGLDKLK